MLKSKFLKFSAFSLAAIALAFNFAACDSGNDEYLEEIPSTWIDLKAGTTDSQCTAVWDKFKDTNLPITDSVVTENTEIKPDSGSGAKLKVVTLKAKVSEEALSVGKNTASLSTLDKSKGILKLTVEGKPTNITVKSKGAGTTELSARFVAIASDKGGKNLLVFKDNLSKNDDNDSILHIKGAKAGDYYIFANGVSISEINASATNTVVKPEPYTSSKDWAIAHNPSTGELSLYSDTAKKNNVTGSAVWKIMSGDAKLEGSKLTITEGPVVVRARIGRFYKDKVLPEDN